MNLAEIRRQIDVLDDEILTLILKRLEYLGIIAKIKLGNGLPIYDESRERAILSRVELVSGKSYKYVLPIFLEILNTSKLIQQEVRNSAKED